MPRKGLTTVMEFNELVSDFAGRYAIGDIFAKDGLAELVIDGTEITLREDAGGGNVVASAVIGEMPPDSRGIFASLALQANFVAVGATALCLDADTGDLSMTASLPLAVADVDSLSAMIEELVNTAEEWRRNATGFMDVDEEAATTEAEALDANPLSGDPGFLRV